MYLRDCPFCKGKAELVHDTENWYVIRCTQCWARTDGCSEAKDAQAFWNARKETEALCVATRKILPYVSECEELNEAYEVLRETEGKLPTAYWIHDGTTYECSTCHLQVEAENNPMRFCPNCGARMEKC